MENSMEFEQIIIWKNEEKHQPVLSGRIYNIQDNIYLSSQFIPWFILKRK